MNKTDIPPVVAWHMGDLIFRPGFLTFASLFSKVSIENAAGKTGFHTPTSPLKEDMCGVILNIVRNFDGNVRNLAIIAQTVMKLSGNLDAQDQLRLIVNERLRQLEKWGDLKQSGHAVSKWTVILFEEIGELCEAIHDLPRVSEDGYSEALKHLREEAVQVAAVCCAWVEHHTGVA